MLAPIDQNTGNNGYQETANPILAHPGLRALLQQQIAIRDGVAPAGTPAPAMMPSNSAAGTTAPPITPAPQPTAQPQQATQPTANEARLAQLQNSKPGLENVYHKITSSDWGQNHPGLGKLAGIAGQIPATAADLAMSLKGLPVLGSSLSSIGQVMPGTTEQHNAKLGEAEGAVTADEANAEKEAQASNLNIQPQLRQAQMALNQNKQSEVENHHQQQIESSLNEHGFTMGEDGKIAPLPYERMSEPQQAVHDLKASQEELANASAELKKAQAAGIPAQVAMAQQRIQTAQQNASTAVQRLGLTKEAMQFREQQATEKQDQPSSIAHGRADQGRAIVESANSLKRFIDTNPQVFGNLDSYWNKFVNDTPISDPMASKAMTELASFAALQPALHGMRSHDAMREFAKMIGGIPKNPESLKAAIDGIVDSAATPMINAGSTRHGGNQPAQGGGNPGVPKGATYTVPGSDGKMHYTDGKNDLGVVK